MYALWRPAEPHAAASAIESDTPEAMHATLHGLELLVEPLATHRWHWNVMTPTGVELQAGDAPTLLAAEGEAEREVLAVHPPGSAWVEHCLD